MLNKIKTLKAYIKLYNFLDSFQFQSGVSLLYIFKTFINKMKEDDIQTMAGAIAFNFTLSLFPGFIFLFTLIPYIPIDNLSETIQLFMQETLPYSIYEFTWSTVGGTIEEIVNKKNSGLLSFGFITAIYLSKNGMLSIMSAFNNVYTSRESRSFIKQQLIAIGLTFLFVLCLVLGVVVLVLGNTILDGVFDILQLDHSGIAYWSFKLLPFLVILILFLIIISLIYYIAPTVKRKLNFFSPGSFAATILIMIVAKAFSYYVDNFGSYNKLYGSIGALLGLMFFFYAVSLIILVGFQVNASIDKAENDFLEE